MPERVQLSRVKGWRMPPNTVKVDRATVFGNPVRVPPDQDAQWAVDHYRKALERHGAIKVPVTSRGTFVTTVEQIRYVLRGKNLACWCKLGTPCHADVLLEIANGTGAFHSGSNT